MEEPTNFGRQIGILARLWRTELDNQLRPIGLSQARWVLLVHLHEAPSGLAQHDLAVRAGVTGPTLVRQIDRLEDAGLVARQEDAHDRRIKRVYITGDGEAMFREVDAIASTLRRQVLAEEDSADVEAAMELMHRLIRRFDALTKPVAEGAA